MSKTCALIFFYVQLSTYFRKKSHSAGMKREKVDSTGDLSEDARVPTDSEKLEKRKNKKK